MAITKDLGVVTAYGYAVEHGYTGTEEEFGAQMNDVADTAGQAEAWAVGTNGGIPVTESDPQYHNNAEYYAEQAGEDAESAGRSEHNADASADTAEAWAVGTVKGVPVEEGQTGYNDNAKYYAGEASESAEAAAASEQAAKDYSDHIADPVGGIVTEWLNEHVDPATGYVIDDTLTVQGEAADAKATGDAVADLKSALAHGIPVIAYASGGISSTGEIQSPASNRYHSELIHVKAPAVLRVFSGYRYVLYRYASDGTFIEKLGTWRTTDTPLITGNYYRVMVGNTADTSIDGVNLNGVINVFYVATEADLQQLEHGTLDLLTFERGSVGSDGMINPDVSSRYHTDILHIENDAVIHIAPGYRYIIDSYTSGGAYIERLGTWRTDNTRVSGGVYYRFMISNLSDTSLDGVDLDGTIGLQYFVPMKLLPEVESWVIADAIPENIVWEVGNIDSSGNDGASTERIRSKSGIFYKLRNHALDIRFLASGYKLIVEMYDANQQFVSNCPWITEDVVFLDIPDGAELFRIMVGKMDDTTMDGTEGASISVSEVSRSYSDIYSLMGQTLNYTEFAKIDGSTESVFDAEDLTPSDVYDAYDALMTAHSDVITRTLLGTDQSGEYQIYSYQYTPIYNPILDENSGLVIDAKPHTIAKALLVSGIHGNGTGGDNTESIIAVYSFLKTLIESEKPYLNWLKNNCTICIIPVANPWGVANKSRYNSRGVDINRNFSYGWEAGEHHGSEGNSEAETVIVNTVMSNNTDATMFLDVHTRGGNTYAENDPVFLMNANTASDLKYPFQRVLKLMDKKYARNNGALLSGTVGGVAQGQAQYVHDITSGLIECAFLRSPGGQKHDQTVNKMNTEIVGTAIVKGIEYCLKA